MFWSKHMRFTYKTNEPRLDTKGFKLGCYILIVKYSLFIKHEKIIGIYVKKRTLTIRSAYHAV